MTAVNTAMPEPQGGLRSPYGGSQNSLEKLPLLRAIFDRAGAICTEELRALADLPLRLSLLELRSGSTEEVFAAHTEKSAVGMLKAAKWSTQCILSAERNAVFALVEMLLGGDGTQPACSDERVLSGVEVSLAGTIFVQIAKALAIAFSAVAPTTFELESTAPAIDFETVNRKERVLAAVFRLDIWDRGGEIVLSVPQAALNSHRGALAKGLPKQQLPPDPIWARHIQKEVTRATMVLSAVLEERREMLGDISRLQVGQILELDATPRTRVRMECNGERLIWCQLGKSNGRYMLRVEEIISREQAFMDDLLAE
jgi:flagellar motor switch protein FliM